MGDYEVRFAPNQPVPPGYSVMWFESSEMYGWECGNKESVVGWDRFRARREAWTHYLRSKALDEMQQLGQEYDNG